MKNLALVPLVVGALWMLTLLPVPLAQANRVSLAGIDEKLDRILAGPFSSTTHVTLRTAFDTVSSCTRDRAYHRVNLDGTFDSSEFVVPADHTLFLTDISFGVADSPTDLFSGRTLRLELRAQNADGGNIQIVYYSPKVDLTSANNGGRPGANESLTAGIAIGAGRVVCAEVSNSSQSSTAFNTVQESVLRGFLVPDA